MRPLETLIPIILAVYLLYPLSGKKRPLIVNILPAIAFTVILIHAFIEGIRWQMIPLYIFTVVALLISTSIFFRTSQDETQPRRPLRVILNLSLLALSTALPILLPVPNIPAPSGPYQVGTRIYELTEPSRKELYSGKDEARRFQFQIWYPADVASTDKQAPWMANADVFAPAISEFLELPSFFLNHLALVKVPAYKDSKVAASDGGFPVILFSHGWQGFDAQNTGQALQLASHGYVVVGMQHPYGALVTVFNDGTIANYNPNALPDGAPVDVYEIAARKLVNQWAGDMEYALGFLTEQNSDPSSPFYGSFDLSHLGVYGHSTGGGAAIQFCGTDTRCKAVLGEDPFMRPVSLEVLDSGVTQPAFFLFSQVWADDTGSRNNQLFNPFYAKSTDTYGALYIKGTAHHDFTDLPLLSPLAAPLGLKGPINGKRVTVIINDYLLSFFDMTLKGVPTDLFKNPSPYPEVNPKP